uniref:RNA helicase aquarius N-terminal domain-containing protein n=1 Tax=Hucho hucho TaxID=62062 RepID=A0A4W5RA85_9TELE
MVPSLSGLRGHGAPVSPEGGSDGLIFPPSDDTQSFSWQAQLPTRRWFNTVLDDSHLLVSCHLSSLMQREGEGHLFCQLLDMLFYTGFGINDQTGNDLTEKETTTLRYDRITSLQMAVFAHFPELQDYALSIVAAVDTQESLTKQFGHLQFPNTLHRVASYLCLLLELAEGQDTTNEKEVLLELLLSFCLSFFPLSH